MNESTGAPDAAALPRPEPISAGLWAALFGVWMAPPWLSWLGARCVRGVDALRARPRLTAGVLLGLVLLAVGGWYGKQWWDARPRPVEVTLQVAGPALTDYANNGAPQPVSLRFSNSVAPLKDLDKPITTGITVTPPIEGTWRWASDKQLDFTPKADWPVGIDHKVTLDRALVAPQIRLQSHEASFTSPMFVPTLRKAEFYQDPVDPKIKKVEIEVGFTHPVNTVEFEKRVELRLATQAEGTLGIGRETTPFSVTYDKNKLTAYVHSAVLAIPKESTSLEFTLAKGALAQAGGTPAVDGLKKSVGVPGLYSLAVDDVAITVVTNERYEPEQVLIVNTSQLVHEREVAKNIRAWLLPLQNPRIKKEEQTEAPYAWSDPREVTDAVLKLAERVDLGAVPAAQEQTQVHSFKLRADVGRMLFVQVDGKTKSFGGYLMRENAQRIVAVPPYPSELRILSQGALLPMSGEKKVAVLVRDLPGLRVELARVQPSQLQHLVSQTQGNFANPDFISSFGPDNITDRFEMKIPLPGLPRGKPHYE
ncbi:MAG: Ig-like domain-containing protein, partial [Burkholderiaceae bacterium]